MATNNSTNYAHPNVSAHAVLISEAAGADVGVVLTTGQVLVGVTGSDPVAQTLANVTTWVDQVTGTRALLVNTGYITDNGASLVTYTLPTTAIVGSVIEIAGSSSGGWLVAQNAAQLIHFGSATTTTGAGGSLASTNAFDSIRILCVVANTTWVVLSAVGNLTVV